MAFLKIDFRYWFLIYQSMVMLWFYRKHKASMNLSNQFARTVIKIDLGKYYSLTAISAVLCTTIRPVNRFAIDINAFPVDSI